MSFDVGPILADRTQNLVYVANASNPGIVIVNTDQGATVGSIPLAGGVSGLALSPNGKKLFVSEESTNQIEVVSLAQKKIVKTITVGFSPKFLAEGVGGKLYVGDGAPDANNKYHCHEIDVASGAEVGAFGTFDGAPQLKTNPKGKRLYAMPNNAYSGVSRIKLYNIAGGTHVKLPGIPFTSSGTTDFLPSKSSGKVYSTVFGFDGVNATNIADGSILLLRFPDGGKNAVAVAGLAGDASFFAADYLPSTIYQFSQADGTVVDSWNVDGLLSAGNYTVSYASLAVTPNHKVLFVSKTLYSPFNFGIGEVGLASIHVSATPVGGAVARPAAAPAPAPSPFYTGPAIASDVLGSSAGGVL